MSDTAEYWDDVKSNRHEYTGRKFYHIPNADCGHKHHFDAKKLGNVNCFACLELIKNGHVHGLEEGTYYTQRERKIIAKENRQKEFDKKNGICLCGSQWVIRNNTVTGIEFLGCSNYPKCKNTKHYM